LQKVAPHIQPLTLHRVNHQCFLRQIVRRNYGFGGQRMIRRQHQTYLKVEHRRVVQAAARQNVGGHHQVQLALLQRRLRVESDAGFEIHHHLRPALVKVLQRRRQPLNTTVTLDRQP